MRVDECAALLDVHAVPNGKINMLADVADMEQAAAMESFWELDHPDSGRVKVAGNPIHFAGKALPRREPPPSLGQHNAQLRAKFGSARTDAEE